MGLSFNAPSRLVRASLLCLVCCATFAAQADIRWRSASPDAPRADGMLDGRAALVAAANDDGARYVVVQFADPVSEAQRGALENSGVKLLSYLGSNAYFATTRERSVDPAMDGVGEITFASTVQREWKLDPRIVAGKFPDYATHTPEVRPGQAKPARIAAVYVLFHQDVDLRVEARDAVAKFGGSVVSELVSLNGLVVELPLAAVEALADVPAVLWIEPALPHMTDTNAENRLRTQADLVQAAPYNLDGAGVSVMVYDGGTAYAPHQDFGGRLTVRDSAGLSYHATHVAGTIGGDGAASGGLHAGMAPGVTLESYGFQYDGAGTFLYSNPGDIESDYTQAINSYGVDISNNSIGTNTEPNGFDCSIQGNYGVTSALIDAIVRGSLGDPFRVVWANGNERQGSRCDIEGFGDYYSTAPPAGAKNHIAVGALNSNNDTMTTFSSWGPTDDGRIKPDLSAPGCQSSGDGGVTSTDNGVTAYRTLCGTSMAAPTVTGLCALMLQDYRVQFPGQPDPRNSTLKILLAHNAVDVGNVGPDYQFGYGSVRIRDTIDFMRTGNFVEDQVGQGESVSYQIEIPGGTSEFKLTIAWDDAPGTPNVNPALVNDLDLVVLSPSGQRAYPWTLNPASPGSPATRNQVDRTNNIEQVLVNNPESGTWTVQVVGFAVPAGPQAYSLCASPLLGVSGPADCNNNGIPDDEDLANCDGSLWCSDCNGNGTLDECDLLFAVSEDCNANGFPDECEPGGDQDCNNNGISDLCDLFTGASDDCNSNGIPDDCEVGSTRATITFDLSSNPGWTTEGQWAHGQPSGGGGQYGNPDPTSGRTGANVYGYNLTGDYANNLPETNLTTTAIDCSNLQNVRLRFWRWLNVERSRYDRAYIRVSNNASTWTTIWSNPDSTISDSSWAQFEYDISSVADGQPTVYIRWTMGATDFTWQFSGWNIDDVEIIGDATGGGPGDCNNNGIPDECDISSETSQDCNNNGTPDECDIASGLSDDNNSNGVPDECEGSDCNNNGVPDDQDLANCDGSAWCSDCNGNGVLDVCDIAGGAADCDGNGAPDECEADSDGDGVIDACDGCPNDPNKTAPGACGCGVADIDSDGDGILDCDDGCPNDPNKTSPGTCGCGAADIDSDGDGVLDCDDGCPNDPNKTAPGACGCGVADIDSDGDAVLDCDDNCPSTPNPGQEDCDNDGVGDACSAAADCNNNGVPDACDIADGTSDDSNGNGIPDECDPAAIAQFEAGTVFVGNSPTTVTLVNTYTSPVVVCSANYLNNDVPFVVRVSNAGATSFDVRLQAPSGGAVAPEQISYLVMEAGVWTIDGVQCEAQRYTSTVTDSDGSWVGEVQSYGQSYTNPVVLGQVMTENDARWSVFWCQGASRTSPPSSSTLITGKTVCEDSDLGRADEVVGFIVFETGHGSIAGVEFEALLGADTVQGVTNNPPYSYAFDSAFAAPPQVAVLSLNGVDGVNGGWAQTHGAPPTSSTSLFLSIDEDVINDSERNHTTEQVGYAVFATPVAYPSGADCNNNGVPDDQDLANCDGSAWCSDCNGNGVIDDCDIAGGAADCDGNGVPDACQLDSDGDGLIDACDGCPNDPNKTSPSVCGCGVADVDSDGDGTPDCNDNCPNDPNKIDPGACGCGTPDIDSDGDGTPDCDDNCPNDPNKIDPGACGCGTPDVDSDGDGTPDCNDNCPFTPNPGQEDCDNDGIGDACSSAPDCNNNAVPDACDLASGTSEDCNVNGVPDECDIASGTSDDGNGNGVPDECEGAQPRFEADAIVVGGGYVTVNLTNSYTNPVVVCSINYSNNVVPVVPRVSAVTATSFDVRLQNPSGNPIVSELVSYIVMEEGVWEIDGVRCEAQTYVSTVTDENNSWVGESQTYGQTYTNPVVIGQVMSENDANWSVFWCAGSSRSNPPSSGALITGKTVCEDVITARADEIVGFIVFEAGFGSIGGVPFEADLGADTVRGVTNGPPYPYGFAAPFASEPLVGIVTQAAMDGSNGGWAYTYGPNPLSAGAIDLAIDEDQISNLERNHTTEQVGYVVFETPIVVP